MAEPVASPPSLALYCKSSSVSLGSAASAASGRERATGRKLLDNAINEVRFGGSSTGRTRKRLRLTSSIPRAAKDPSPEGGNSSNVLRDTSNAVRVFWSLAELSSCGGSEQSSRHDSVSVSVACSIAPSTVNSVACAALEPPL